MKSKKQDRQGARTIEQLLQRYRLDGIGEDAVSEMIKQLGQVNEHLALIDTSITQKLSALLSSNQTWFYGGVPTLGNYPVTEWESTMQKDNHVGDFYYDTDNGRIYIFTKCDGVYEWKSCFGGGCTEDHDAIRQEGYDEGFIDGQAKQIVTGTFTLETNIKQPTITHDCGFVPSLFMVYPIDTYTLGNRMAIGCIIVNNNHFNDLNADRRPHFVWECQDAQTVWYGTTTSTGELTETTAKLPNRSNTYVFQANFQYGWIAFK